MKKNTSIRKKRHGAATGGKAETTGKREIAEASSAK